MLTRNKILDSRMLPNVSEFDEICRTCLAKGGKMEPLHDDFGQEVNLFHMLETCTSLPFTKGDILPSHICHECLSALKNAYEFRQCCERSDTTLRAVLKQSFENYVDKLKSGDESNHVQGLLEPKVEIKVEIDDEEGEVSKACNNLVPDHLPKETTKLAENSDQDDSTSEDEFKVPKIKKGPKEVSCDICNKKLSCRVVLKKHMRNVHNPDKPYKCSLCELSYARKDALATHQLSRHKSEDDIKRTTCEVCGKVLSTLAALKGHLRQHDGIKDFMCTVCGKLFLTNAALALHEKVHSDEMPYECEICGKKSKHNNMAIHMRTHTGEKPFECTECGRKCVSSGDLKNHMRIHTGEKPYECKVCLKTFRVIGSLKIHEKSHTGVFEHFCSVCNKGFYQSTQLKSHMRMHTGEKPFQCKICGKSFGQSCYKTIHMNKVHRKKKMKTDTAKEEEGHLNEYQEIVKL